MACTFILLTSNLRDHSFAYVSHYPEPIELPIETTTSTLVYLIDQISGIIRISYWAEITINQKIKLKINESNKLHVFLNDGTKEERNLIQESFTLLNDSNCNVENLFNTLVFLSIIWEKNKHFLLWTTDHIHLHQLFKTIDCWIRIRCILVAWKTNSIIIK